jgi:hypothetical protein
MENIDSSERQVHAGLSRAHRSSTINLTRQY